MLPTQIHPKSNRSFVCKSCCHKLIVIPSLPQRDPLCSSLPLESVNNAPGRIIRLFSITAQRAQPFFRRSKFCASVLSGTFQSPQLTISKLNPVYTGQNSRYHHGYFGFIFHKMDVLKQENALGSWRLNMVSTQPNTSIKFQVLGRVITNSYTVM